jgi:hypothetical protein
MRIPWNLYSSPVTEKQFANACPHARSATMRLPLAAFFLLSATFGVHSLLASQEPESTSQSAAAEEHEFADIQNVVKAVYQSVSFEIGSEPNWELMRSTLMDGAIFSQPPRRPDKRKIINADAFIESFKSDLDTYKMRETGFWERVVHTTPTVFGNTATVLVVFEVRVEKDSATPMGRGLDSISMIKVDGRWWVTSILTDWERPGQNLPAELLPAR